MEFTIAPILAIEQLRVNNTQREILLTWSLRFFLINCCCASLIGTYYIYSITPLSLANPSLANQIKVWFFLITALFTHFSLIVLLPFLLIILPFIWIIPRTKVIIPLSILCIASILIILGIDAAVFHLFRFHLQGVFLKLLFSSDFQQIFNFSNREWLAFSLLISSILGFEIVLAWICWKKFKTNLIFSWNKILGILSSGLIITYLIFLLGATDSSLSLTTQARALPWFDTIIATLLPLPDSLNRVENLGVGNFAQLKSNEQKLNYPLHALQFATTHQNYNIVLIVIDTWRFDMLNATVTPHLTTFAKTTWQFTNHYSGGNATLPGIFSLFYSIPSTYVAAAQQSQSSPILVQALQQANYDINIFASAGLIQPPLAATFFNKIPNLQMETPGISPFTRDQYITQKFIKFLKQPRNKPFFAFLFYDGAHGFCDQNTPTIPFQPIIDSCDHLTLNMNQDPKPYLNRYQNALFTVDQQINKVLSELNRDNTIIIVTGDHGEEFNDNHHNYWEHASNYTPFQTKTPFIMFWPGKAPHTWTHVTSHYDLAPTLLEQVLQCRNPIKDYSVGQPLLSQQDPKFLIIGSYVDFGILQKDTITRVYPGGNYAITDLNATPLSKAELDKVILREVMENLSRYY